MTFQKKGCAIALAVLIGQAAPAWATCDTSQPDQTPSSRYAISGDAVHDKKTNLTWQRCSLGQHWQDGSGCVGEIKQLSWDEAQKQAGGGWRMPTKDELVTLIAPTCKNPAINEEVFPGMELDKINYWTSTPNGPLFAWVVLFDAGSAYNTNYYRTNMNSVRLVRKAP